MLSSRTFFSRWVGKFENGVWAYVPCYHFQTCPPIVKKTFSSQHRSPCYQLNPRYQPKKHRYLYSSTTLSWSCPCLWHCIFDARRNLLEERPNYWREEQRARRASQLLCMCTTFPALCQYSDYIIFRPIIFRLYHITTNHIPTISYSDLIFRTIIFRPSYFKVISVFFNQWIQNKGISLIFE